MSLLFRYLTKNNAMILLPTLAVGIGLYVLTDLFERLDNFIEAGLSVGMVLTYFVVKMPLVISQILPQRIMEFATTPREMPPACNAVSSRLRAMMHSWMTVDSRKITGRICEITSGIFTTK